MLKRNVLKMMVVGVIGLVNAVGALPVTDGLVMHLDAGAISGVSNGSPIGVWVDQSGNGNDANQPTAGNQPLYIASESAFLNNPVVRFDGTDDYMILPSTTMTVGSFTMFAVAKYDDMDNNQYICAGQDGGGNDRARFQLDTKISGMDPQFLWRAGSSGWKDIITDADLAVHVFGETSDVEGFLDGTSIGTASNSSNENPTAFNLGSYNRGEKDFFDGDLAEFIVYDRVLSPEDFAAVNDYLAAKYVPEPTTMMLMALGLVALARHRK